MAFILAHNWSRDGKRLPFLIPRILLLANIFSISLDSKKKLVEMSTQTEFSLDIVEHAYSTIADYVRSKDLDADVKAMMSRHLQEAHDLCGKKNPAKKI